MIEGYTYTKPSRIDCAAQGCLYSARDRKQIWHAQLKRLRTRLASEPLNGNRHGLRLEIMRAQEKHREALRNEAEALHAIELRANELGLTTKIITTKRK